MKTKMINEKKINDIIKNVIREFVEENNNVALYDRIDAIQEAKVEIADKIEEMINKFGLNVEEIQGILNTMVKYFSKMR